jgi:outer membrane protein OmpA-like peptidoglycan-associated protein
MSGKAYASERPGRHPGRVRGQAGGDVITAEGNGAMTGRYGGGCRIGRRARVGVLLLAGGLLAGCTEAWETVSRPLDPLPPAQPDRIDDPQQGAGEYPKLSSVPEAPPRRPSRKQERDELRESLAADRAGASYTGEARTADGIEAGQGEDGRTETDGSGAGDAAAMAPAKPDIANRMPADDAGAATDPGQGDQGGGRQAPAEPPARPDRSAAGSTDGGAPADGPDVPQLEPSEQGEPIEVPAQPSFDDGEAGSPQSSRSRPQQQQSARRDGASAAATPTSAGPEVGRSRTLSREEPGNQTLAGGGRRVAVIYFQHGSARLQARDRQVLRRVADIYERQQRDLRVVGHASSRTVSLDPIDHRMANFDTSLQRAQAVVDALVSMGVPRDSIQLEARGDSAPVYHEFMPTGEAGNRRAEIFLQG